jgi:hypothetical protein
VLRLALFPKVPEFVETAGPQMQAGRVFIPVIHSLGIFLQRAFV